MSCCLAITMMAIGGRALFACLAEDRLASVAVDIAFEAADRSTHYGYTAGSTELRKVLWSV